MIRKLTMFGLGISLLVLNCSIAALYADSLQLFAEVVIVFSAIAGVLILLCAGTQILEK